MAAFLLVLGKQMVLVRPAATISPVPAPSRGQSERAKAHVCQVFAFQVRTQGEETEVQKEFNFCKVAVVEPSLKTRPVCL